MYKKQIIELGISKQGDNFEMKKNYMLKTVKYDMTSHGGFRWKKRGLVVCPDWNPIDDCGNGLHGALNGEGDGSLFGWSDDSVWIVAEVDIDTGVDLDGKWKFPEANVIYAGNRKSATDLIYKLCGMVECIGGTATDGDYGTAKAGDYGTATAGNYGTATAGDGGIATASYRGTATASYRGTATAGDYGTAKAGNYGTATAGNYGTATAGNFGTATAGDRGTATAGDYGTATAGNYGTATAGCSGIINIAYYSDNRRRIKTGYVGEDGLKPDVKYKLDVNHNFVEVE